MTDIVNGNKTDNTEIDQWIDRRSKFGNPFKISDFNEYMPDDKARDLVVELYREYFFKRIRHDQEFREAVQNLKGKTLACHCKPERCHGDVIIKYLAGYTYSNGRWWQPRNHSIPDTVECGECGEEARRRDDGAYKCLECGNEMVFIG